MQGDSSSFRLWTRPKMMAADAMLCSCPPTIGDRASTSPSKLIAGSATFGSSSGLCRATAARPGPPAFAASVWVPADAATLAAAAVAATACAASSSQSMHKLTHLGFFSRIAFTLVSEWCRTRPSKPLARRSKARAIAPRSRLLIRLNLARASVFSSSVSASHRHQVRRSSP